MKNIAVLIAGSALLTACSSEPEIDMQNASVADVANEVADAGGSDQFIRAGMWQTKVTVEDIDIPGMPASAREQMKGMFAQRQNVTVDHCVTPEEAKRPRGDFFTGKEAKNCRYETFTMSGGKVDALMRCQGEPSGSMTMKMAGTYTADSSTTRSEMVVSGGEQGNMTVRAVTTATRVGDCNPKKAG